MGFLIQDVIGAIAERHPEALMVQDDVASVSYGEAERDTNRLARFLYEVGVRRGDRVAFFMEKGVGAFTALIAILKADGVYVPLDYHSPLERVRFVVEDCGCRHILCDSKSLSKTLDLLEGCTREMKVVVWTGGRPKERNDRADEREASLAGKVSVVWPGSLEGLDSGRRECCNIDDDLAYIIYTSGSTGVPKGVMISHRNVVDYARWTVKYFGITPEDRLSSHAMLHFDLSVFDVYTAFAGGASLHPVPRMYSMFPLKVMEFVEERRLTVWCSVPSFLSYMARSGVLKEGRMSSLRAITFCGEVMPTKTIIQWMKVYPRIRYVNQYGPTETTCASMYYEIEDLPEDPGIPIPIGRAIPNTEVFAVGESGKSLKAGEAGELCIRGAGNGLGYWNNPARTSSAFVQNPLHGAYRDIVYATGDLVRLRRDGLYGFLGRKDSQIKYMGHRIELGEIESLLNSLPYVSTSAVVGVEAEDMGGTIIAAFVRAEHGTKVETLRDDLGKKLPHYMIPKKFVFVEKMPLNANGKIDRLELKSRLP